MSDNEQPIEWFLARDGKRHGPLSDLEMRKIVELGHLRTTDLIWRQGLVEWTPASIVFPAAGPAEPAPAPKADPAPKAEPAPEVESALKPEPAQPHRPAPAPAAAQPAHPAPAQAAQSRPQPQPQHTPHQPQPAPAPASSTQAAVANVAQHLERDPRPAPAPVTTPVQEPRGPRDMRAAIAAAQWDRPMTMPANGPHSGPQPVAPQPAPQPRTAQQQPAGAPPHGPPHQQMPHPHATGPRARPQTGSNPAPMPPMAPPVRMGEPMRLRPGQMPMQAPPPQAQRPMPAQAEPYDLAEPEPRRRRRFPMKTAAAVVILSALGGAAYALHKTGRLPMPLASVVSGMSADGKAAPAGRAPRGEVPIEPALLITGRTAAEIDEGLQKSSLWKLVKREFAQWYAERITDAAKLRGEQKDDKEVSEYLTKQLIDLRRRYADAVLAASPDRLMLVAVSFVENLSRLAKHSTDACYGYISQGENSPLVLDLIRSPEHTSALQAQFKAIIEAAAEGRRSPKLHKAPGREDYDVLAAELGKLKWTPADLQTFSDARALSQASPERVCQMVQDWFLAQLAVKDEDVKIRLLVEALKPVVSG